MHARTMRVVWAAMAASSVRTGRTSTLGCARIERLGSTSETGGKMCSQIPKHRASSVPTTNSGVAIRSSVTVVTP